MSSNILYSTWNIRGALCLAKHPTVLSPRNYGKGKHHTVIWYNLSLFYSIQFLPLFGEKNHVLELWWDPLWMWENWVLCHKNLIIFSIRKEKIKINYTRYIFLDEEEEKKKKPIFPSSNMETKNETSK